MGAGPALLLQTRVPRARAPAVAPQNTELPTISGDSPPRVGSSLTALTGSWSGTQPFAHSYQWYEVQEELETLSEAWSGSDGDPWSTERWVLMDDDGGNSTADIQGGSGRLYNHGREYSHVRMHSVGVFDDLDLTTTFTLANTDEQYHSVLLRASGSFPGVPEDPADGYRCRVMVYQGTAYMTMHSLVGGASETEVVASISKGSWGTGTWNLRVRAEGATIKMKAWQGTEPAGWDLVGNDAGHTVGALGFSSTNATTATEIRWDDLVVLQPVAEPEPVEAVTRENSLAEMEALRPDTSGAALVTTGTADIQAALDGAPGIIMSGGNYGSLRLFLADNKFVIAADGEEPIFDGANGPAIYGTGSDCWIERITIQNCITGGAQVGAIAPSNEVGDGPAWRWKIVNCKLYDIEGRGIGGTTGTGDSLAERAIISHCVIEDCTGTSGIGGPAGWTLTQWCDVHRCNPDGILKHWDGGALKFTGGRSGTGAPTATGDIVRYNRISYHGGPGIWFDWGGHSCEIYGNSIWGCDSVAIILECWAYGNIHNNKCGHCCMDFKDTSVTAFNAFISLQNSKNCLVRFNTIFIDGADYPVTGPDGQNPDGFCPWLNHVTYQERTESQLASPQGDLGIGWFRSTDNTFQGNTYLLLNRTGTQYSDLYTDTFACSESDPTGTGDSCYVLTNPTDNPGVDFQLYADEGDPYPLHSLRHDAPNNHWWWLPQPTGGPTAEEYRTQTLNNVRTEETILTEGFNEPDWQTIDVVAA